MVSGHPYMWAHVLWPQEPRFGWTMQMSKCFQRGSGQCFRFTEATTDDWTYRAVSNIIAKQLLAPEEKCRPAYEMLSGLVSGSDLRLRADNVFSNAFSFPLSLEFILS
ncbi:hypothetical protein V6N12_008325 [Hibiscus sabdariffa]|uniref:Uncharacterized protein n=1 Tax=Hibiscus sabdariffa TaxID=183260 RepID=A0ABR2B3E8_9ROSI